MRSDTGRFAAIVALLLALVLRAVDPLPVESARLRGFDLLQRMAPRSGDGALVRIVAIDEASLARHGQWPWPRALVARLVERVAAAEPKAVALDMLLAEPDRLSPDRLIAALPDLPDDLRNALRRLPDGDSTLAAALGRVPAVLGLGTSFDADPAAHGPLRVSPVATEGEDVHPFLARYPALLTSRAELRAAERGRGVLSGESDRDGILRRLPLFVSAEGKVVPSLAADTVRVAVGGNHLLRAGWSGIEAARVGGLEAPVDGAARAYLHFAPALDGRYVSAAALLDEAAGAEALRGTVVLVGLTGLGLVDVKQTPLGPMDGVEVQAQLVESILVGSLLHREGFADGIELLVVLLAGLAAVALPQRRPAIAAAGLGAIVLTLLGGELAAFRVQGLLLDAGYPALVAIVVFGIMLSVTLRAAEQARQRLAADLAREREENARLEGELATARTIQMGLLPHRFPGPPERSDVETYALIEPARSVGGDLYDLVMLDDRRLFFMVADVSGKGVPAALFMAMCKEVLRDAAYRHGEALDQAFIEANAKIAASSDDLIVEGAGAMFVTVLAAVLDLQSGKLVHASAGHAAPYLLRPGGVPLALEDAGGPPLGTVAEFPWTVASYALAPGDLVLLYTDGIPDAEDRNRSFYSAVRFVRALSSIGASTPKDALDALRKDVGRFVADAEATDDITLLAVRWVSAR